MISKLLQKAILSNYNRKLPRTKRHGRHRIDCGSGEDMAVYPKALKPKGCRRVKGKEPRGKALSEKAKRLLCQPIDPGLSCSRYFDVNGYRQSPGSQPFRPLPPKG